MKLKLACSQFSFPRLSHEQSLDLISSLGFLGVDVGIFCSGLQWTAKQVLASPERYARRLKGDMRTRGLRIADVFLIPGADFSEFAVNHPSAKIRQKSRELFLRGLEFVVHAEAKHLTQLPGRIWPNETADDSLARAADELAWRTEQACAGGVTLAVEPHIESVIATPEKSLKLLSRAHGLTLTLDYGHFVSQGIPPRRIEPLLAHASHLHARAASLSMLQASLKLNAIDFKRVLRRLSSVAYRGWIALEYVWIDWQRCNEVDTLSETLLLRDHLLEVAQ